MNRVVNRVLITVIGLVLVAGGTLVIIEAIWSLTNNGFVWIPGDSWLHSFETTAWSDPVAIAISVAAAALGLLLFAFAVWPRRPRAAAFPTEKAGHWSLLRRPAEAHLQRRLAAQVPVTPIKARLNPKPSGWTLKIKARSAASTRPALEQSARAELAALRAPSSSRVQVATTGASASPA
jgi:hypothetical protein